MQTAKTLPASSEEPRVACILLWYPLFTQPFIFREIETLKKYLPITLYTLYGANHTHCSREMLEAAACVHTHGLRALPRVLFSLVYEIIRHPKRFFSLFTKHMLRPWPNLEIFGENLWAFCMGLYLKDTMVRDKITLIYAPWPRGTAQTAWVLNELLSIPFVMTVRGDNLQPADPDLLDKMRAASCIRTNNYADKKRIEDFGDQCARNKTKLIYNSLTLPQKEPTKAHIATYTKNRPLALMALGRFDVTKGFDVLIRACAILKEEGRNCTLTLAGGGGFAMGLGALEGMLKKLVAKLNLESCVTFPGLISHNDLPDILQKHDIFIAPCVIDEKGRRDGIPNTLIEAMSCGLPVIASNIHALPEIVKEKETGLLVEQKNPKALANAIAYFADNPKEAAKIGEAAAKFVQNLFDPMGNAKKLAQLLKQQSDVNQKCAQ